MHQALTELASAINRLRPDWKSGEEFYSLRSEITARLRSLADSPLATRTIIRPIRIEVRVEVERPPVAEFEQIQLVLAQSWVAHVGEAFACREGCAPWQGDVDAYITRLVTKAAQDIHGFLVFGVPVWQPKMWHPQSGRLHRAVERVIHLRIQARGGGCELCHAPGRIGVPLELHHLHYRSFGREVPTDVMRLCRQCHDKRHAISGYPRDTRWQDSIRWGAQP